MTFDELDDFLRNDIGLVSDAMERGAGKTYFLEKVTWLPSDTTRVVRVLPDAAGNVMCLKLCVSSDNNNSVLIKPPFEYGHLRTLVNAEIEMLSKLNR